MNRNRNITNNNMNKISINNKCIAIDDNIFIILLITLLITLKNK